MSLNLFRRLDRYDRRIRQLERTEPPEGGGGGGGDHADSDHADAFSPLAHTHAVHADSDHDDRFSLLAHTHAGVGAHTHDWVDVTGEPATFPPTSHDSDHDDRFSLLAHTHIDAGTYGRKYVQILAGTGPSYNVIHNFGVRSVIVDVFHAAAPYETVECGVERPDTNTVTVTFSTAPAPNEYWVTVIG